MTNNLPTTGPWDHLGDLSLDGLIGRAQEALEIGAVVSPLVLFGQIGFNGADTCSFLHNQLSSDLNALLPTQAQYSSYCTPKGRMLATLLVWRTGNDYILQLPRELLTTVQKRLSMYILRSKTKARDASDEQVTLGIAGPRAYEIIHGLFPTVSTHTLSMVCQNHAQIIVLPGRRYQILVDPEMAESLWHQLVDAGCIPASPAVWTLSDIRASVPWITVATQEEFVPLMVNMDITGGVSFTKGCYPGQEIVARMHYLGHVKRRMIHARVSTDVVHPGQAVLSPEMQGQASGKIVLAAPAGEGTWEVLVIVQISSLEQGMYLGNLTGPQLEILDLLAS